VYILEAHSFNEWPLGNAIKINQHKTLEDRIAAAKSFIEAYQFSVPLVVDGIENPFNSIFAAWPERFFITHNRKLVYISHPGVNGENTVNWIVEVRNWLKSYRERCMYE